MRRTRGRTRGRRTSRRKRRIGLGTSWATKSRSKRSEEDDRQAFWNISNRNVSNCLFRLGAANFFRFFRFFRCCWWPFFFFFFLFFFFLDIFIFLIFGLFYVSFLFFPLRVFLFCSLCFDISVLRCFCFRFCAVWWNGCGVREIIGELGWKNDFFRN